MLSRAESLEKVKTLIQSESNLELIGIHPQFGEVKLKQLLSTWFAHDLIHIAQIVRVMAKRYKEDVGHWVVYLGNLVIYWRVFYSRLTRCKTLNHESANYKWDIKQPVKS
nr:hypothetical protein [Paucisalibacillus globulus]